MRPLYFDAVTEHPKVAPALLHQTEKTLRPFVRYLDQAERAAKSRQSRYRLPWTRVQRRRRLSLDPLDTRVEIPRPGPGWRAPSWPAEVEPDPTQPLMILNRGVTVAVNAWARLDEGVRIEPAEPLREDDQVFWCARPLSLVAEPAPTPPTVLTDATGRRWPVCAVSPGRPGDDDGDAWLVVIEGRWGGETLYLDGRPLAATARPRYDGLGRVRANDGTAWAVVDGAIEADQAPVDEPVRGDDGVRYTCRERGGRQREVWVQLDLPDDDDELGAEAFLDPRAAFCEDQVREVWTAPRASEAQKLTVKGVDREQYRLRLDQLPPDGSRLHLPLDVRNLQRQRRALHRLVRAPLPHQRGLLRLCEDPGRVRWPSVVPVRPDTWYELRDETRSGTEEQRQFVAKALGSPDLCVLEGPPGSGKTTAICELIRQLVGRGRRVLLCASTHVAIDNVLERLVELPSQPGSALGAGLEAPAVDAVRIGRLERVDPRVQATQLERRVEALVATWRGHPGFASHDDRTLAEMAERTVLMAAGLTCGTTMGINAHPWLQDHRPDTKQATAGPRGDALPRWDVLIVDEASKTTIQEFMVPALLARRWVIVGDVHQLPPFAERADITANLRELADPNGRALFGPEAQRARLLAWYLHRPALARLCTSPAGPRRLIVERSEVLDALEAELGAAPDVESDIESGRERGRVSPTEVVRVIRGRRRSGPVRSVSVDDVLSGAAPALSLWAARWLLVAEELVPELAPVLPPDLLVTRALGSGSGTAGALPGSEPWLFRRAAWRPRTRALPAPVREFGRSYEHLAALEDAEQSWLGSHDWAGELAWRITRVHELAGSRRRGRSDRYQREITALTPPIRDLAQAVDEIRDVGLPSIIEVLQRGIGEDRAARASALTEGLRKRQPAAFEQRFVSLAYQHRMHAEIADLPRELFYRDQALHQANTVTARDAALGWDFAPELGARRAWRAVRGREHGGVNQAEVDAMAEIVREFLAWAQRRPPPPHAGGRWEVACLSFYVKQEGAIRRMLRDLTGLDRQTRFAAAGVDIVCGTVDRFQGREADLVLLSLRNTRRVGFLDSVNRLNVAITRARQQLVILGHADYFSRCGVDELEALVDRTHRVTRRARRRQ
ncbi:AAA domain-containing protein [Haliangium sp.]|uniref:AAA domain-containing protein n=1 Tax=Haliangium sp. TaxID=2663208 RepID=UPI003D0E5294